MLRNLGTPENHFEGLLGLAGLAASAGRFAEALRYADRARRLDPVNPTLATLCARLLMRLDRPGPALAVVTELADGDRTAQSELERAQIMLALGDGPGAAEAIEGLLATIAVDALEGFPILAEAVCETLGRDHAGWVGLSSDCTVVGALGPAALARLQALAGQSSHGLRLEASPAMGRLSPFRLWTDLAGLRTVAETLPHAVIGGRMLKVTPASRLNAAGAQRGSLIAGSEAPPAGVRGISLQPCPGSSGARRSDEPALVEEAAPNQRLARRLFNPPLPSRGVAKGTPGRSATTSALARTPPPTVAVIVPVYSGSDESLVCLRSVIATTDPKTTELIVIEDAGLEPKVTNTLQELAAADRITLVVDAEDLGVPQCANHGIGSRPQSDVVLLNPDAEVFGDWLERLQRVAYSEPSVATVSAFSNDVGLTTYPAAYDQARDSAAGARLDCLFREVNAGLHAELPSGAGVCVYIRRACIDQIGGFEVDLFGSAYGVINDFCLRASKLGWRHLAAADVFVRRLGERSRQPLEELATGRDLRLLYERHPTFQAATEAFVDTDPLQPMRRAIDERLLADETGPSVLLITLGRDGGVRRHVRQRTEILRAQGCRVVELLPNREQHAGGACRLSVAGQRFNDLTYRLPHEMAHLIALLRRLGIAEVEVHHFLGLDPIALTIPARLGVPYDVFVHDYSWICPRITLVGGDKRYCGEPDLAACERCIGAHGGLIEEEISVQALRARSADVLSGARRVVVPSEDGAARLRRYFPKVKSAVIPWETPVRGRPAWKPRTSGRVRVAMVGAITEHKGYERLLACARDARDGDLPLEFVVIGYTEDDFALFETGRVFVTGRYGEGEVASLIKREKCDVAFQGSIWPETWCYALTHLLHCGLPVLAFSIGAVTGRLEDVPHAVLTPLSATARELNELLIGMGRTGSAWRARVGIRTSGGNQLDFDDVGRGDTAVRSAWVEGFRISLSLAPGDPFIEYSALAADGVRTDWVGEGSWCAVQGRPTPLIGFSVRPARPGRPPISFQYGGVFSSGVAAPPFTDAGDCYSATQNDPLVGIWVAAVAS